HLTRALEHESDERKRLSLLLSREEAWGQLGDHPHRDADLEAARELSAKLDDAASEREVALREALALDAAGQKTAALEILDREQERPGFDEASEARLLNRSAMIRLFTGDFDRATPSLERAREIARRLSLPELEAEALQLSGLSFYLRGQYDDALQNMSSALSLRKALDDSFRAASLESNLGLIHLDRGQLRAAAEHFEDSLSLFRRVRHLRGEVVGLVNLGLVQTEFGRYESALHHLGQALRLRRDLGDRHGEASDLGNLGFVWFRLGKYERAVPLLNSAIEVASETENRGTMAINESRLAAIETLRGGFASAADRLATAQDLATNHAQTLVVGTTRARFLLRSERVDEAQSVADNALATARGAKMKTRIVDCLVLSATCQLARGDLEGADASSAEAVSEVESMNSWIAVSQEAYFVRYRTLSALRQRGSAPEPPEDSLRRAYGLLREKADALHDDDIRASFLRDDELNREIDLAHAELQSRTRTEADLRERSFYEIAKSIHAIVELDPLLDRLLEIAIESTRADKGLILLREGDESFTTRAARGMARESVDEATDICRSVIEDVTRGGRPVLATDANSDQRFRDRESIISFQIRTLMCVPLSARDEVLGAVYVDGRGAESFAPNDLDYLVSLAQLAGIAVDNARLLDRLKAENRDLREEVATRFGTGSIVAQSKGMESLLELARKVAHSDVSVLISGETGTGKSLIARTVHYGSPRSSNPFVTVDCGALPENLLESELFGHRRGAFSGAIYDRVGLFEEAEGGTLFLDEISNTSLDLQAKLLRAIQEGEIRRVGDNEVHRVNVRILAASNRDLLALVSRGEFREDLYYRLNVVSLVVPPLRDRPEDIPALAKRFLAGSCERLGRPPITISDEGLRTLYSAPWPGNVRELENTIERAVVLADGSELDAASFSILHDASEASVQSSALSGTSALPGMRARSLEEFDQRWLEAERDYLLDLVENADWNLSAAARAARVRNRNTFISRLKKHGIQRPEE
ncbi:MAG: sigma 54-interacting transcriptional regulator, partial [Planctomycetota bacterium]